MFSDDNNNGVQDAGEAFTTTRADGTFTLVGGGNGPLVMVGGTDVSTGLAFDGGLKAPTGSTVITPLTTLISTIAAAHSDPNDQAAVAAAVVAAQATIATAFGISSSIDLTTFDPVSVAANGTAAEQAVATSVLATAIQVQTTIAQISAATGSTDVLGAVASTISAANGGAVDLTHTDTLTSIVTQAAGANADPDAVSAVTTVVQAANTAISTAASSTGDGLSVLTNIAQAATIALGQTTDQLQTAGLNATNLTTVVTDNTGQNLSTAIATAPVGDPDGAQVGGAGSDTLTGGRGNDIIQGLGGNDVLAGGAGNDLLDGGDGQDVAAYDSATSADGHTGINVAMATGVVTGDASVGTDTLRSIETVRGSAFNDTYDATGYWTGVGTVSANQGTPSIPGGVNNSFEGLGGDDVVIGNGRTTVSYFHALAGVTVNLSSGPDAAHLTTNGSAFSTAAGDAAGVGQDTLVNVIWLRGSEYDDILNGGVANDVFVGGGGNDAISGGAGFDLVNYSPATGITTTGGLNINMTTGVVLGDASVGTDTLRSIESVRGTSFNDTYTAAGYGTGANVGNFGTFNEFEGMGGTDAITGNNNTRILYYNATAGVTVDLLVGTADGDSSVGHDTLNGIAQVRGSAYNDTLSGSNTTAFTETFDPWAGTDTIDGRGGFDQVVFNGNGRQTQGVNIDMGAGRVTGVVSDMTTPVTLFNGVTTLRSIEQVTGSNADDVYNATNFGAGGLNVGNNGTFNSFQGAGGNDTITGNGNTQIAFFSATAGVTVNLALGTASGDASVGNDTILGGVTNVQGSNFDDSITGGNGNESLNGGTGNDTINGGGGNDSIAGGGGNDTIDGGTGGDVAVFTGARGGYTINFNTPGAGQVQVIDGTANRDGTDTLSNVELLQFSDSLALIAAGSAATPVNLVGVPTNSAVANPFVSLTNADDYIALSAGNLAQHPIDLGAGYDTISISGGINLNLTSVENIVGSAGKDFLSLTKNANGLSIDLGGGTNDSLNLAGGANSINVNNVEFINSTDFQVGQSTDDTLTLLNNQTSGVFINLGNGNNTLNLFGSSNSFNSINNVQQVNGTAGDDTLSVTNGLFNGNTINLGAGNDTLNLNSSVFGLTITNVENINLSAFNDTITIGNSSGTVTVTGGGGGDFITASAGADVFRYTSVSDSPFFGAQDTIVNFDVNADKLLFQNMAGGATGFTGQIHFMANGVFDGNASTHVSEARLVSNQLQIDVDGDGVLGGNDIQINLNGFNGPLTDANFQVSGLAPVNHAPTVALANVLTSTPENGGNVKVADIVVSDDGIGNNMLSLSGADAALFSIFPGINGPELHFNGGADFEAKSSYQVTVNVDDPAVGGAPDSFQNFTLTITDVNEAPTAVVLANPVTSTPENGGNIKVADIVVSDDALGTNVLSLGGADAASFAIINGAGGKELHFIGGANYEAKATYNVTVNVDDGSVGGTPDASQNFTLAITDVNEAPALALANPVTSTSENGGDVKVADIVVSDDAIGNNILSLSGADAAAFSILPAVGGAELHFIGGANYEVKASYHVTVNVDDPNVGGTPDATQDFTLAITDVNEAPTAVILANAVTSTPENGGDIKIANIQVTDDALGTNNLTLSGADATSFTIVNGNELHFLGGANYEAKATYNVTVNVDDPTVGGSPDAFQAFALAITNQNEQPTNITLSNATVNAASANGTVVGALTMIDPDVGDHATFTLTDNDGGKFGLDANGNLIVASSLAGVTSATQQVTVHVVDSGGLFFDKQFTITVTGVTAGGTFNGTSGDDVLNGTAGNDSFQGFAGNDTLNGNDGQDNAFYSDATSSVALNNAGITVNMAAGTVSAADGSVGNDTLRSIETVIGSNFNDTYSAAGYWTGIGTTSTLNIGSVTLPGTINNGFEGLGGDDSITGNGRTTVSYFRALSGVTVQLSSSTTGSTTNFDINGTAASTLANDAAGVGHDTLISVNWVRGSEFNDALTGGTGNDVFVGGKGNDTINGGAGFDLDNYSPGSANNFTSGITVNMTTGAVTSNNGQDGNDTLRSIESVRGTNFDDSYTAANFGAAGFTNPANFNVGNNGTFNEFEGMGGTDNIVGNSNTRILYYNSTGGVTVDLAAGTADGDASVGHDTLSGIAQVRGSSFDDHLSGSNRTDITEVFDGWAGNDTIDGRGGFDQVQYNNNGLQTSGIHIDMTAGIVTGVVTGIAAGTPAFNGTTILRSIEQVFGTNAADIYDATNFGAAGLDANTHNVGNNGTFNSFQGLGGNDTIIGNGNTQILYGNATAAVTIDMTAGTAQGTAAGDVANVGLDHFSGVNNVQGSNFNDSITGSSANEVFGGAGGNDTINGGGGNDTIVGGAGNDAIDGGSGGDMAVFSGAFVGGTYTINLNTPSAGQVQVIDTTANRDGTDVLTNVELLQFTDTIRLVASGTVGTPVDMTGLSFFTIGGLSGTAGLTSMTGTDDFLMIGNNLGNRQIDLGAGTGDTVFLGQSGGYQLNLANVEKLTGSGGDDFVNLVQNTTGLIVDLGNGTNDNLNLANGANSLSVTNVERIGGSDFGAVTPSSDTLTLLNDVSGVSVDLGNGTNTLNLFAGTNNFSFLSNLQQINGTSANDTLSIDQSIFTPANNTVVNLGLGDNTLNFGGGFLSLSALNVQHIIGTSANDSLNLQNDLSGGVTVHLGGGNDFLNLANGSNTLSIENVAHVNGSDFSGAASNDTLTLQNNVSGLDLNLGQGTNSLYLAAGANSFTNLFSLHDVHGTAGDDTLSVSNGLFNNATVDTTIDLGGGSNDTLNLGDGFYRFFESGIEHITGGNTTVVIDNAVSNLSVTLTSASQSFLQLGTGASSVEVHGVNEVDTLDYNFAGGQAASDDSLTLLNTVSGLQVNLQQGDNTLTLAQGVNSLTNIFSVNHINGSSGDDTLTTTGSIVGNGSTNPMFDLGTGNDTVNFNGGAFGVTVVNAETINGSANNDTITIGDTTGHIAVTGGGAADFITVSTASVDFHYGNFADSSAATGVDQITNFDATYDQFVFDGLTAAGGGIDYLGNGSFETGHASAISQGDGQGNFTLQIDMNGDGTSDMQIQLNNANLTGLNSAHFLLNP